PESVVNKWSGDHIRRGAFFSLRDAKSISVRLQHFPGRIGKPGVVAEFKRERNRGEQKSQKILQQHGIRFQIRRQLQKDWSQLAGGSERLDRRQKARNKIFRPL